MCRRLVPVITLRSSANRCCEVATPGDAYMISPGFSFASLSRSGTVLAGRDAVATSRNGYCATSATGTKSLSGPWWVLGLQAQGIGRPAGVGAALEHAGLLVGHDRADGAGEPRPVRPPADLVAEAAERLAGRLVDPALHVEQTRMIGVRL